MADRIAPAGGYEFAAKEEYRHKVWQGFHRAHKGNVKNLQALLMPSLEGTEIEVAKRYGFREENLHVVDMNPAIVATLKKRFPKINTYGVTVGRACERIAKAGVKIDVANFDFTSCIGPVLEEECLAIAASGSLAETAKVAVTVLRGRESKEYFPALSQVNMPRLRAEYRRTCLMRRTLYGQVKGASLSFLDPEEAVNAVCVQGGKLTFNDAARIAVVQSFFGGRTSVSLSVTGTYRSGPSTMLWYVFDQTDYEAVTHGLRVEIMSSERSLKKRLLAFHSQMKTLWVLADRSALHALMLSHLLAGVSRNHSFRNRWLQRWEGRLYKCSNNEGACSGAGRSLQAGYCGFCNSVTVERQQRRDFYRQHADEFFEWSLRAASVVGGSFITERQIKAYSHAVDRKIVDASESHDRFVSLRPL